MSQLPATSPCRAFAARPSRAIAGFTLLETGLALLALGLAAYIATVQVRKFQHRTQRDQFIGELRAIAAAFEEFHAQTHEWPVATNPDAPMPHGMEKALANTPWLTGPPFGGSYAWTPPMRPAADKDAGKDVSNKEAVPKADEKEPAKAPAPGAIVVTAFSPGPPLPLSEEDLRYIDAKLDDGNLATGRFRTGFNHWPVYLVSPPP